VLPRKGFQLPIDNVTNPFALSDPGLLSSGLLCINFVWGDAYALGHGTGRGGMGSHATIVATYRAQGNV